MLAAVFQRPGRMEVMEVDTPDIGADEVLVKVGANTICGTDVRIFRGEKTKGIPLPTILGHEMAGHVYQVGRQVRGYEVGAPVAMAPVIACYRCFYCQNGMENVCPHQKIVGYDVKGGLSEYVRIPADAVAAGNLFVAQNDVPSEYLALAEPLACCVNGHRRSQIRLNSSVLIMGSGPIGLFHLQLSLLAGARTVIVSEPSAPRRAIASTFGAHITVDPTVEDLSSIVSDATGGLGVDSVIICIGVPSLVNDALHMARQGGRINIFAGLAAKGWAEVEANLIHYKELEVTGTANSRRTDYQTALQLIESGRIEVGPMVTDRYPLRAACEAFDKAASREGIKVAVLPFFSQL
ncbi:MAG TPA: alcohol dehydrogenase catalytic domain-containing protein [Ktedonobacteraceae bacterium]|nr:alcohol dehydrogenase catalytic domain-containing protein [Ktedonobacteraceae bacterium]